MPRQGPPSQSNQKVRQQKTSRIDFPALKGPLQPQGQKCQQSSGNPGGHKKLSAPGNSQQESHRFQYGMPGNVPSKTPGWHSNPGPEWQNDPGGSQQFTPGPSHQNSNGPVWPNRSGPTWYKNPEPSWPSNSRQPWQSSTRPNWYGNQEAKWQERPMPRGHQPSHAGPVPGVGGWSNDPGLYPDPRWQDSAGPTPWQADPGRSRAQPSQQHGVVRVSSFSSNNSESFETGKKATSGSRAGGVGNQIATSLAKSSPEKTDNFNEAKSNTHNNSKSHGKGRTPAKQDTSTLRVITSTIHGAKKWNKNRNMLGLTMFEVFAIVDSATLKDSSATGKEFLLRDEGNSLACIFYEIDHLLPRLVRGQWYRCVGKFKPAEEKFQCFSIRLTTVAERKLGSSAMRQAETYLLKLGREP